MHHLLISLYLANDYRVVLSTENYDSDYICASYIDVSFRYCPMLFFILP